MGLVQRLKHDLRAGWAGLRYGTARAAYRALEETELLTLRLQVRNLDGRIRDLCRDIGERAVTLRERGEAVGRILSDGDLIRLAELVQTLKAERAKLIAEMEEIQSGETS